MVAGGLARNTLLMQIYSDILRLPLSVITSTQGPALGSAIHAAVAAGAYPGVAAAAAVMGRSDRSVFTPVEANADAYDELFAEYTELHDYFGRGASSVMHRLKAIQRAAHTQRTIPTGCAHRAGDPARAAADRGTPGVDGMSIDTEIHDVVRTLREQLVVLHAELPRNELVVWTAGNASARVPGRDLLVIKPSGVSYDELTADSMVVTDFDGTVVDGVGAPSSDTAAHAYVYRHLPDVGGVVHTHSTYACAWAALRRPVPCVLTMMGRRVRWPDPDRPVRPDRRRLHRSGHRGHVAGQQIPCGADGQPRAVHRGPGCPPGGEGRGDVRGSLPRRVSGPPTR